MALVHLQALLPSSDGTGWYAAAEGNICRCSTRHCQRLAVAYHHHPGTRKRMWRNKYRCMEHLPPGLNVMYGRVWLDRPPKESVRPTSQGSAS